MSPKQFRQQPLQRQIHAFRAAKSRIHAFRWRITRVHRYSPCIYGAALSGRLVLQTMPGGKAERMHAGRDDGDGQPLPDRSQGTLLLCDVVTISITCNFTILSVHFLHSELSQLSNFSQYFFKANRNNVRTEECSEGPPRRCRLWLAFLSTRPPASRFITNIPVVPIFSPHRSPADRNPWHIMLLRMGNPRLPSCNGNSFHPVVTAKLRTRLLVDVRPWRF